MTKQKPFTPEQKEALRKLQNYLEISRWDEEMNRRREYWLFSRHDSHNTTNTKRRIL